MNFKSWLQKIKDCVNNQTNYVNNDFESNDEHQNQINVSVCKFINKTPLKNVPPNEYVIIDKIFLNEDIYDESIKKRFIFKINNDGSYKVDDVICYGAIITYEASYNDPENKFDGIVEVIGEYLDTDKYLTLREVCDRYFQDLSLINIKHSDSYRMTIENIIFRQNHNNKCILTPNYFEESNSIDDIVCEICEYTKN